MRKKALLAYAAIAAMALPLASLPVQAATITIQATGRIADTTFANFTAGSRHFRTGRLALQTSDPLPLELSDGDVVEFTLALDGTFVVPASGEQFFGFNLEGEEDQQAAGASNSGTIEFLNVTGLLANPVNAGCGNCLTPIYFGGSAAAFSFDGLSGSTTISLALPYRVTGLSISYQLSEAVPEPTSWALIIGGFGLAGGALRRRTRVVQLA